MPALAPRFTITHSITAALTTIERALVARREDCRSFSADPASDNASVAKSTIAGPTAPC
jgi:hypothetical protein